MELSITIGQRIRQAERLPRTGSLEQMLQIKAIKNALVGFAAAQLESWRIVEYDGSFITGCPNTPTIVRLTDEMVVAWAELIRQLSAAGKVIVTEVDIFNDIVAEAENIINANNENQEQGEGN